MVSAHARRFHKELRAEIGVGDQSAQNTLDG
jgi:hypothetical protein